MKTGFFETLLLYQGTLPLAHLHEERYTRSARLLRLPFSWSGMEDRIRERMAHHNATARVRIAATPAPEGPRLDLDVQPFLFRWEAGWSAGIYPGEHLQPGPPYGIKPLPYQPWARAADWAEGEGWNEALLLNNQGCIAEGSRTNLFLFRGGRWSTPPLSGGCVAGVMRRHLMNLLQSAGTPVTEESITPDQLLSAEGAALTNALRGVIPLSRFGATALDTAPALALQALLRPTFPAPLC